MIPLFAFLPNSTSATSSVTSCKQEWLVGHPATKMPPKGTFHSCNHLCDTIQTCSSMLKICTLFLLAHPHHRATEPTRLLSAYSSVCSIADVDLRCRLRGSGRQNYRNSQSATNLTRGVSSHGKVQGERGGGEGGTLRVMIPMTCGFAGPTSRWCRPMVRNSLYALARLAFP